MDGLILCNCLNVLFFWICGKVSIFACFSILNKHHKHFLCFYGSNKSLRHTHWALQHCKRVLWNEEQKRRVDDCQGCQLHLTIEKRCIMKQRFLHFVCNLSLWEAIEKILDARSIFSGEPNWEMRRSMKFGTKNYLSRFACWAKT